MTGTAADLTIFGPLARNLGTLYWLLALAVAALLWWKLGTLKAKITGASLAIAVFALPVLLTYLSVAPKAKAQAQRFEKAKAHFEMRCQSAGERIVRTVDNVDGVVWMKWRELRDAADPYDQFKLNDPFGRECTGKDCVEQLLALNTSIGRFQAEIDLRKGRYQYVESIDPADGKPHRYIGVMVPRWSEEGVRRHRASTGRDIDDDAYWFSALKTPIERLGARYGITWDDISTREDRELWIAGGSLKVIDLQSNEVIAERIGYMWDRGLGNRGGERQPWSFAQRNACPPFEDGRRGAESRKFVQRVLKPSQGE